MWLKRILIIIALAAIPLWYGYRTVREKPGRRFNLEELIMTEDERQKKHEEEQRKAKEEAEAERVKKETELEKATAARKAVEAEQARAQALLAEKRAQENAEAAKQRLEAERRGAEIAAVTRRAESERSALERVLTARSQYCIDKAKEAEERLKELVEEQKSFRAFADEMSRVPLPAPNNYTLEKFSKTFRMLYPKSALSAGSTAEIRDSKEKCESVAHDVTRKDSPMSDGLSIWDIKHLAGNYESSISQLKSARSDIKALVDFFTNKIPDTVGGQVTKVRVQEWLDRAYQFKEQ